MKLPIARLALVTLFAVPSLLATDKYQVTGTVKDVDSSKITVVKGKENFEIALGSAKVPEGVKAGSKVTVHYTITASEIESKDKPAAPAKTEKPAKSAKKPAAAAKS